MVPVDGAQGVEGPLHVLVELPEAVLPPEAEQVDPAVPPRVRDLLQAPHLRPQPPLPAPRTLRSFPHPHLPVHRRRPETPGEHAAHPPDPFGRLQTSPPLLHP